MFQADDDLLWSPFQITRQEEKANAKIQILTQAYQSQLDALNAEPSESEEDEAETEPSSSDESVQGEVATRRP